MVGPTEKQSALSLSSFFLSLSFLSLNPSRPPHSFQDEAARLEAWNAEKPELQAYIAALAESRSLLRKQLQGLEATRKARAAEAEAEAAARAKAAAAAASPPPAAAASPAPSSSASNPPSPTPGFNVIAAPRAPGVPPPSDAALVAERDRLLAGVARLEHALAEARARADGGALASNPFAPPAPAPAPAPSSAPPSSPLFPSAAPEPSSKAQEARDRAEADVWASQLVALQDTLRLTRLEAAAADVELAGRARLSAARLEKEAAERAGETAAARCGAQVMGVEARLDRLKMALYFPKVKVRFEFFPPVFSFFYGFLRSCVKREQKAHLFLSHRYPLP
jgi:hypothetical protein